MVEPVALAAPRSDRRRAAADGLADRPAATMAAASEPVSGEGRVGSAADLGATRPSLWQRDLADTDRRETGARIRVSRSWKTQEVQISGLIPFSVRRGEW